MYSKVHFFFKELFSPLRLGPSYPTLPKINREGESSIKGLYVCGDAAGDPLLKVGLNRGYDWTNHAAQKLKKIDGEKQVDYDIIIVGCGATGFAAANRAHELKLSYLVLESERFANVIQNFTKGKYLFAEPASLEQKGSIWFEECNKELLLEKWNQHRQKINLNLHEFEKVEDIKGSEGHFELYTNKGSYSAKLVLLAIGKSGNPRKANVPGEVEYGDKIYHFLADADIYQNKSILIYGGGDVACEAALALCDRNKVTMATIDKSFIYPKKRNSDAVLAKVREGKLKLHFDTKLVRIGESTIELEHIPTQKRSTHPNDLVFEMIGSIPPIGFFKKIGITMENSWKGNKWIALVLALLALSGISLWSYILGTGATHFSASIPLAMFFLALLGMIIEGSRANRYSWLALTLTISYLLYALKSSSPHFPFHWLGADRIASYFGSGWWGYFVPQAVQAFKGAPAFWYSALYTFLVLFFGVKAMIRWGVRPKDSYQIKRYISIMAFQLVFFIVVNMVLSVVIGKYYWRGWGLYQPFPLFFNSFFWWYPEDPVHIKWFFIGFGLFLTFVAIPLFVRRHGMRFCTWICGCGGLAETFGDRWRHLSAKGPRSQKWEFTGPLILIWAFISLFLIFFFFNTDGNNFIWKSYDYLVDFWLVAVIPIGLYPFFGGKVWCRYWCPLAHYMKWMSKWFGTLSIKSNDKCISCTQCSKYCQVGVDVMAFAKNQERFDNTNSSCIHCGICITVCPMDVLEFDTVKRRAFIPEQDIKSL